MKNKTIDLFGSVYSIEYQNSIKYTNSQGEEMEIYGKCDTPNKKIYIAKTVYGKKQSTQEMQLTLYHEFIHAALIEGQYLNVSTDEPLVEWLARCLLQAKKDKVL